MPTARIHSRRWRGLTLAAAFIAACLFLATSIRHGNAGGPPGPSKLSTVLEDLARSVPQEGVGVATARTVEQTPFSPESLPKPVRDAMQVGRLQLNSNHEVRVYILMTAVSDRNLSQLESNGVTIEITDAHDRRVQARIPVSRLQSVADLPFVNFVRLPSYAVHRTGSVDTEGDAILHADEVRQQLKLDGTGVRVGVISDGLKGVFATGCATCSGVAGGPISTGDLPSATGTRNSSGVLISSSGGITGQSFQSNGDLEGIIPGCAFAGAGAEGTALLEIVHDIAPGAQLSFANADTDMAFKQAVNALAANNDIVMDDVGFFGLAADGSSAVSTNTAAALNNSSNRIRAYFTAVGNSSNEHTYGLYADSGVNGNTISGITNSGNLHQFQQSADTTDLLGLGPKPYNVINLAANGTVAIFLTWDDPFGGSSNNYDLYLVQESTGKVVAHSTNAQTGTQDPEEDIVYTNPGSADNFHIVIQNVGNLAQAKHLNLFSFQPECAADGPRLLKPPSQDLHNYNTASRSVTTENDAGGSPVSVISVGAICSASAKAQSVFAGSPAPDLSCTDTTNSTIEFFSSQGPTLDGRTKPEISGIDGVSVTGAGSFVNPFFGSSAATPHLAGIGALLLQGAPCLVNGATGARDNVTARTNLRSLVLDNAVPLGGAVPNDVFGFGRADAFASAGKTLPVFTGPPAITVNGSTPNGASVSAAQVGFTDPNSCPLTTLAWTGGCGTGPASSMTCPFGTTNVSVMASNNALSFSAAANLNVVVTNFSVGASPGSVTVAAGQPATYTVTVSAQGGAFTNAVTLGCTNLPAQSSCAFSPPMVTPGSASAQSTLSLSTTVRSLALPTDLAPPNRVMRWAPLAGRHRGVPPPALWLAVAAFAVLGLMGLRAAGQRRLTALSAASIVLAFLVMVQVGCGGGSSSSPPPSSSGTPAGTFSVGITGTSGTLVESGTATLVVQ